MNIELHTNYAKEESLLNKHAYEKDCAEGRSNFHNLEYAVVNNNNTIRIIRAFCLLCDWQEYNPYLIHANPEDK
jgi:hypothetical protein